MTRSDPCDPLEKLVNRLNEQLYVLSSQSQGDPFLQGLVDLQGLIEMTQAMLKDAERRLANCRQHRPLPNALFLVTLTDANRSGSNYRDQSRPTSFKLIAAYIALGVLGLSLGVYILHGYRVTQRLAVQGEQVTASLNATRSQIDSLIATVNSLAARPELLATLATDTSIAHRTTGRRHAAEDPRLKKLQSRQDAQGKANDEARSDLSSAHGDLTSANKEVMGSIAQTQDDAALLRKKGETNYYEFDIDNSKNLQRDGRFAIRLKKVNIKRQYVDLELLIDDRKFYQGHVNVYQPVMFYMPNSPQPTALVINSIGADRIRGYVSIPKYQQSEFASISNVIGEARVSTK